MTDAQKPKQPSVSSHVSANVDFTHSITSAPPCIDIKAAAAIVQKGPASPLNPDILAAGLRLLKLER